MEAVPYIVEKVNIERSIEGSEKSEGYNFFFL
jgi:hypothetical protein